MTKSPLEVPATGNLANRCVICFDPIGDEEPYIELVMYQASSPIRIHEKCDPRPAFLERLRSS